MIDQVIKYIEQSKFLVVVIIFVLSASPAFFVLLYKPFREWFFTSVAKESLDTPKTKIGMFVMVSCVSTLIGTIMLSFILNVEVPPVIYYTLSILIASGMGITLTDPMKILRKDNNK